MRTAPDIATKKLYKPKRAAAIIDSSVRQVYYLEERGEIEMVRDGRAAFVVAEVRQVFAVEEGTVVDHARVVRRIAETLTPVLELESEIHRRAGRERFAQLVDGVTRNAIVADDIVRREIGLDQLHAHRQAHVQRVDRLVGFVGQRVFAVDFHAALVRVTAKT